MRGGREGNGMSKKKYVCYSRALCWRKERKVEEMKEEGGEGGGGKE